MPILIDRRTYHPLGRLTQAECDQLARLFEEPAFDEDGTPVTVDPRIVEMMLDEGDASREMLSVLEQLLQGRETFDLAIEPDPR